MLRVRTRDPCLHDLNDRLLAVVRGDRAGRAVAPGVDLHRVEIMVVEARAVGPTRGPVQGLVEVGPGVPVDRGDPGDPGDLVVLVGAAVSAAPEGVATQPVLLASPEAGLPAGENPSGRSGKSSTIWKHRPSAGYDYRGDPAKPCGFLVEPR